jgi:hypothetical protein
MALRGRVKSWQVLGLRLTARGSARLGRIGSGAPAIAARILALRAEKGVKALHRYILIEAKLLRGSVCGLKKGSGRYMDTIYPNLKLRPSRRSLARVSATMRWTG